MGKMINKTYHKTYNISRDFGANFDKFWRKKFFKINSKELKF